MTEPKSTIAPLSLAEVAFEHFADFFDSIVEQAQFTPEQQLALREMLKESVEKRDKMGNCLHGLTATQRCYGTKRDNWPNVGTSSRNFRARYGPHSIKECLIWA
jgi:hypothetical protein